MIRSFIVLLPRPSTYNILQLIQLDDIEHLFLSVEKHSFDLSHRKLSDFF